MRKKTNSRSTSELFSASDSTKLLVFRANFILENFLPSVGFKGCINFVFQFQIPMALRNVGKPVSGASKKLQVDPQNDQNPSKNYGDIRKCKFREFLFQWELFC